MNARIRAFRPLFQFSMDCRGVFDIFHDSKTDRLWAHVYPVQDGESYLQIPWPGSLRDCVESDRLVERGIVDSPAIKVPDFLVASPVNPPAPNGDPGQDIDPEPFDTQLI